jgi:hypothetical protein
MLPHSFLILVVNGWPFPTADYAKRSQVLEEKV